MNARRRQQLGVAAAIGLILIVSRALMMPTPTPPGSAGAVPALRSPAPSSDRASPSSRVRVRDEAGEPTGGGGHDESWSTPLDVPDGLRTMGLPIFVDGTQMGAPEAGAPTIEPVWDDTDLPEPSPEQ